MKSSFLQQLTLRYVDQEQISLLRPHPLNTYPLMSKNDLNFEDIFQIDQSDVASEKDKSRFFSQNNLKADKAQKTQLTLYLKQNLGNIKARRKTIHHIPPTHIMKKINNVSLPNNFAELVRLFLQSKYLAFMISLTALLNLIGICMIDYSFRVEPEMPLKLSRLNSISLCLQMVANWVFTFQILMKIYLSGINTKQPYLIVNIVGTFATWATIFFNMMDYDNNLVFRIMVMVRIIRSIIRIIQVTSWLKYPFQIFMKTIPSLQRLFFPFTIIFLFYAITGMALFPDSNHYLCVSSTSQDTTIVHSSSSTAYSTKSNDTNSTNSSKTAHYGSYCGSSMYHCQPGQTCKYVEQQIEGNFHNQYNLITFNSIDNALLTVYHYVFNSNFHVIRSKFTYFINPYVSSVYFISMSIFLFYIFSNLIMISMSKAYMQQIDHHQQKDKSQQQSDQPQKTEGSLFEKIINFINIILAVVQFVILALTYEKISSETQKLQSLLDFIISWVSLLVVFVLIIILRRRFFKDPLNVIDLVSLLFHFISLIICLANKESVIYSLTTSSMILRSIKAIRLIRVVYCKESLFRYQKFVIKVFLQTIFKVKSFLMLCLCFSLMFKLIGQLLFAFLIRFDEGGKANIQNGSAYTQNFQSFTASLYTVFYLFLNQRWTEIMYLYYSAVGWVAIGYFVIVVFISHMMLIRLYIAVFLCYFKQELHKKSKQELITENNSKAEQLRDVSRKLTAQQFQHQQSSNKSEVNQQGKEQERQDIKQDKKFNWPLLQCIYYSNKFYYFVNGTILVHCLTIILNNEDNQKEKLILKTIETICFGVYILQVIIGCLIDGVSFDSQSYFQKSRSNVISLLVAIVSIVSFFPLGSQLATLYLRRITIVKVFTFFRQTDKEMSIVVDTIFNIIRKFINFLIIYSTLLLIIAIIPLKLLNNDSYLFDCKPSPFSTGSYPHNQAQCLNAGGTWLQNQHFSNIFTSAALMYQLVSSESWTIFVENLIRGNKPFGWQIFFILVFFVYNICFLGIVMGFIVETYLHLKDKAYNLNRLKPSQKCWILIKNSINCLTPRSIVSLPAGATSLRKSVFQFVTNQSYLTLIDYLPYFNVGICILLYSQNINEYVHIAQYFRNAVLLAFTGDMLLKVYAHRLKFFQLNNSIIQVVSGVFIIIYCIATEAANLNEQTFDIMNGLLTAVLLLRCKSLLLKYSWCKTNLNSIIDILPKCAKIIKLACAVLFFYAAIGLQIFKNLKENYLVDNYNYGYDDFLTGILTLVKVIVCQSWYEVLSGFLEHSTVQSPCHNMFDYAYFHQYGKQACGSWLAYPYFLTFHILMVLLVMNLLIATMASAYDENYVIEYNSVNIFQLEDCLSLWQKYDPMATGVVHYKKFWKLTSEIAILFGISKKKLIKRKNKFFEELDLQVYQSINSPMLCYRFHDVITKFSKIKLQVANIGHKDNPSQHQDKDNEVDIEFDISPVILKEIQDYVTPFPDNLYFNFKPFKTYKSGETKYIFGLLKKIRHWKHMATQKKRPRGGAKLSSIFELVSKKNHNFQMDQSEQYGFKQL